MKKMKMEIMSSLESGHTGKHKELCKNGKTGYLRSGLALQRLDIQGLFIEVSVC